MKKDRLRDYKVSFVGLKLGTHNFQYKIQQEFFDLFDFEADFSQPNIVVDLTLLKSSNLLEFDLTLKGEIQVLCDLSLEEFDLTISGDSKIIIKFGENFDFTDDKIWTIPHGEHSINMAQFIYESILVSIPKKRIHPKVKNGELENKTLKKLKELDFSNQNQESDPRWEALKKLK